MALPARGLHPCSFTSSKLLVIQIKLALCNPSHLGWMSQLIQLHAAGTQFKASRGYTPATVCKFHSPFACCFECVSGIWELSERNLCLFLNNSFFCLLNFRLGSGCVKHLYESPHLQTIASSTLNTLL